MFNDMNLCGYRSSDFNAYVIKTIITIPSYGIESNWTPFLIDTGSTHTTIGYGTALDLGIPISGEPEMSKGTGGRRTSIALNGCRLSWPCDDGKICHLPFDSIYVSKQTPTWENWDDVTSVPSLLGMEFLQHCNIFFHGEKVVLQTHPTTA